MALPPRLPLVPGHVDERARTSRLALQPAGQRPVHARRGLRSVRLRLRGRQLQHAADALAQARPTTVDRRRGGHLRRQRVDRRRHRGLTYEWDFGDGSPARAGQVAHHAYATAGTYKVATLTVTDAGGLTDQDTVTVTVLAQARPAGDGPRRVATTNTRQGEKVTFTATVRNTGGAAAGATQTRVQARRHDGVGTVATPPIAAGASRQVAVELRTNGLRGQHVMRATADRGNAVARVATRANNWAQRTFTIKGNKVTNGSFEQAASGGATLQRAGPARAPAAGSASYSQSGGTEGSKAASTSGNGGNALGPRLARLDERSGRSRRPARCSTSSSRSTRGSLVGSHRRARLPRARSAT